jgi:hypothetical protein
VDAKALISEHAEIGFDVDKADDLEIVRQRLERRRTANTATTASPSLGGEP